MLLKTTSATTVSRDIFELRAYTDMEKKVLTRSFSEMLVDSCLNVECCRLSEVQVPTYSSTYPASPNVSPGPSFRTIVSPGTSFTATMSPGTSFRTTMSPVSPGISYRPTMSPGTSFRPVVAESYTSSSSIQWEMMGDASCCM